jgi:hypothetical protein
VDITSAEGAVADFFAQLNCNGRRKRTTTMTLKINFTGTDLPERFFFIISGLKKSGFTPRLVATTGVYPFVIDWIGILIFSAHA